MGLASQGSSEESKDASSEALTRQDGLQQVQALTIRTTADGTSGSLPHTAGLGTCILELHGGDEAQLPGQLTLSEDAPG